jgi:hypothetical protein
MIWSRVAETLRPRPMTLQQLNQRVQIEADARFSETVEHLLFLLDYQRRLKEVAVKCYCEDLQYTQHDRMCGYCRSEDVDVWEKTQVERIRRKFGQGCY